MSLVIDANIFAAYFQESIIGNENNSLTGSPVPIFENLKNDRVCYFDDNGFVKTEWMNLAEPEWFNAWYADQLINGNFLIIPVNNINALQKKLNSLGFPKSNDIWYIKICKEVCKKLGSCILISEDMDFYEPKKKNTKHKERIKIITSSSGSVARYLKKKENIYIKSVSNYISENLENNA